MDDAAFSVWSAPLKAGWKRAAAHAVIAPYAIAVLAVAAALGVRLVLGPVLGGDASWLFFFPAILIASAFGGWGAGIAGDRARLWGRPVSGRGRSRHLACPTGSTPPHSSSSASVRPGAAKCCAFAHRSRRQCGSRVRPRGACQVDPRQHSRSHDRHRRTRRHAVVQLRGANGCSVTPPPEVIGKNVSMLMPQPYRGGS